MRSIVLVFALVFAGRSAFGQAYHDTLVFTGNPSPLLVSLWDGFGIGEETYPAGSFTVTNGQSVVETVYDGFPNFYWTVTYQLNGTNFVVASSLIVGSAHGNQTVPFDLSAGFPPPPPPPVVNTNQAYFFYGRVRQPDGSYVRKIVGFRKRRGM